jgi:hypothetical protein
MIVARLMLGGAMIVAGLLSLGTVRLSCRNISADEYQLSS